MGGFLNTIQSFIEDYTLFTILVLCIIIANVSYIIIENKSSKNKQSNIQNFEEQISNSNKVNSESKNRYLQKIEFLEKRIIELENDIKKYIRDINKMKSTARNAEKEVRANTIDINGSIIKNTVSIEDLDSKRDLITSGMNIASELIIEEIIPDEKFKVQGSSVGKSINSNGESEMSVHVPKELNDKSMDYQKYADIRNGKVNEPIIEARTNIPITNIKTEDNTAAQPEVEQKATVVNNVTPQPKVEQKATVVNNAAPQPKVEQKATVVNNVTPQPKVEQKASVVNNVTPQPKVEQKASVVNNAAPQPKISKDHDKLAKELSIAMDKLSKRIDVLKSLDFKTMPNEERKKVMNELIELKKQKDKCLLYSKKLKV